MSQYFNQSGRAYPDVSAQATDFIIYVGGSSGAVDGTSCATPTFASIIQLLNSDRLSNGKSGLGFLNPWLYGNATSGLKDITSGGNSGCDGSIDGAGFSAVAVSLPLMFELQQLILKNLGMGSGYRSWNTIVHIFVGDIESNLILETS